MTNLKKKSKKKTKTKSYRKNKTNIVTFPSQTMNAENNRTSNITAMDLVKEYTELPFLPDNIKINIDKLGVYNWNTELKVSNDLLKYNLFTSIDSEEYPVGLTDKSVSPVIIIDTNGTKYKVKHINWVKLAHISDAIMLTQGRTGIKILPTKICTDDKWISKLSEIFRK